MAGWGAGDPHAAFAGVGQVAGRNAERRRGRRGRPPDLRVGRGTQHDRPGTAGAAGQKTGDGYERKASQGPSSEKVGPNVVFHVMTRVGAPVHVGLIETIRARDGRIPWLGRHLERLHAAIAALDLAQPLDDLGDLVRITAGSGDRVVRLELREGHSEITTRDVSSGRSISVVVSGEEHRPYPHKTTSREQFGRALADARRAGANDALLVTAEGYVAEGTAWNLFWWHGASLCTPAADLGVLTGIGRGRVMELEDVQEERVRVAALAGRSLFLVNAVRGIVEIGALEGAPVPRDPRTAELSSRFWPD